MVVINRTSDDWAAIRADYENSDLPIRTICRRHRIGDKTLHTEGQRRGWRLRHVGQRETVTLAARMAALLERQLAQLEAVEGEFSEKQVQLLGHLARTLGKINDLDKSERAERDGAGDARNGDYAALRQRLEARFAELARGMQD